MSAILTTLLRLAQDMTEPGELNYEYVRGQAELIGDACGLSLDEWRDPMMAVIGHCLTISDLIDALYHRQPLPSFPALPDHAQGIVSWPADLPGDRNMTRKPGQEAPWK